MNRCSQSRPSLNLGLLVFAGGLTICAMLVAMDTEPLANPMDQAMERFLEAIRTGDRQGACQAALGAADTALHHAPDQVADWENRASIACASTRPPAGFVGQVQ